MTEEITDTLRQFVEKALDEAEAAAEGEGYGEPRLSLSVKQAVEILNVLNSLGVRQALADEAAAEAERPPFSAAGEIERRAEAVNDEAAARWAAQHFSGGECNEG